MSRIAELRDLLGELLGEATFLVQNIDNEDETVIVKAGSIEEIEDVISSQGGPGAPITQRPKNYLIKIFDSAGRKDAGEKLASLKEKYATAGNKALAIVAEDLINNPSNVSSYLTGFTSSGVWNEIGKKLLPIGGGGATETTGTGEIALFCLFADVDKAPMKEYDLEIGPVGNKKLCSVKYFSSKVDSSPKMGSGTAELDRYKKNLTAEIKRFIKSEEIPTGVSEQIEILTKQLKVDGVATAYEELSKLLEKPAEEIAKAASTAVYKALIDGDTADLIAVDNNGWKVLDMMPDGSPPIALRSIEAGNRPRFSLAPKLTIAGASASGVWVPASKTAEKTAARPAARAVFQRLYGDMTLGQIVNAGEDDWKEFKTKLIAAQGPRSIGSSKLAWTNYARKQGNVTINSLLDDQEVMKVIFGESRTRGSSRKRKHEFSGGGVAGVTTPLGTDASGGKGGPGVRKGKGKSILDRNAKSQGKFFGRAKRVNESSTYASLGRYLYTNVEFGDYDLDNDGEGDLDSKSVFRGGGGNLGKNAATTGKSFAGAKPVKASKVIKEATELLNELLPPTRGITRQKPSLMAAINGLHPQVLDETHVRLVLGMKPLSLNEGHVNEAHLRAILREQLIYEGWWDSAKQLLGQGIDKIKEKAEDAADAVKAFGDNTKGVVAGLWVAASDGKLLEAITKTTRYRLNQGLKSFLKPLYRVANSFKDAGFDLPMTIVNKIKSGLDKFTEGLNASGWKGLLTSMAAFLGMRWISENFEDKIKEITGKFTGADKKIDASLEKAKELANSLTGGIIEKVQEKLEGMLKSFAGSAIEQLAGPLAWIKKIAEVLGTVDWVTSKLIGLISMGKFSASIGRAN